MTTFKNPYELEEEYYGSNKRQYMSPSAPSTFRTGNGTGIQRSSAGTGMNPRINVKGIPLERRDGLELLPEMNATDTAPLPSEGYDRYQTTFLGKIHDHHQRGRTDRPEATSVTPTSSVSRIHQPCPG